MNGLNIQVFTPSGKNNDGKKQKKLNNYGF
jgi:hypothetical protein